MKKVLQFFILPLYIITTHDFYTKSTYTSFGYYVSLIFIFLFIYLEYIRYFTIFRRNEFKDETSLDLCLCALIGFCVSFFDDIHVYNWYFYLIFTVVLLCKTLVTNDLKKFYNTEETP